MTMNTQGRPTALSAAAALPRLDTVSGSRGLLQHEDLLFEIGTPETTGVDLPKPKGLKSRLGGVARKVDTGLPGLSEPQAVRHYMRLSQRNYAIDLGLFPLGSCTMKHNPRLNEKMARLPGFADIHPLQPQATVQGALELIDELATWLKTLTGMPSVAMSPKAGAHGELCGMLAIRQARHLLVEARIVLHRARAEREEAKIDGVVPLAEAHIVAHRLRFREPRQSGRDLALHAAQAVGLLLWLGQIDAGLVDRADLEDETLGLQKPPRSGDRLAGAVARDGAERGRSASGVHGHGSLAVVCRRVEKTRPPPDLRAMRRACV